MISKYSKNYPLLGVWSCDGVFLRFREKRKKNEKKKIFVRLRDGNSHIQICGKQNTE